MRLLFDRRARRRNARPFHTREEQEKFKEEEKKCRPTPIIICDLKIPVIIHNRKHAPIIIDQCRYYKLRAVAGASCAS